jgi:hypothetical protein
MYLMPSFYKSLGELIQVGLDTTGVGKEEVRDHAFWGMHSHSSVHYVSHVFIIFSLIDM